MDFDGKRLDGLERAAAPWSGHNAYSRRLPSAPAVFRRTVMPAE